MDEQDPPNPAQAAADKLQAAIMQQEFSMNCPANTALHGAAGAGLGVILGLVVGSYTGMTDSEFKGTFRERLRTSGGLMRTRAFSYMKGFGAFSVVYEASLCTIEKQRAVTDPTNHGLAGCVTGGAFGARAGGLTGACLGCAGMAAFSYLIETFLHTN
eukprot:c3516_g1_i1.p1 GENE.c3516_g1_i1~~c3516_g1_i1.p1  ORF type:complete len:158 (+),score=17.31 c3516_g1_i1:33-506(+)